MFPVMVLAAGSRPGIPAAHGIAISTWLVRLGLIVSLGGTALTVIGIVTGVAHHIDLEDAVIVPNGAAEQLFGLTAPGEVQIRTALGAAQLVGRQAPIALAPNQPDALQARGIFP